MVSDAPSIVAAVLHPAATGHRGVLEWRLGPGWRAVSSSIVGGGSSTPRWVLNVGVPLDYSRLDIADHVAEVAAELDLSGPGVGLLTAATVARVQRAGVGGVAVDATVGITKPTWAADPSGGYTEWAPGTINIVAQIPVPLDDGAAVNMVMTITEAKSQALIEAGVPGTGTASDAVVVLSPDAGTDRSPEIFGGPRSVWGARLAQASHQAVAAGIGAAR